MISQKIVIHPTLVITTKDMTNLPPTKKNPKIQKSLNPFVINFVVTPTH
jgi:hypothetical protein